MVPKCLGLGCPPEGCRWICAGGFGVFISQTLSLWLSGCRTLCPCLTDFWCFCSPFAAAPSLSTFPFFPTSSPSPPAWAVPVPQCAFPTQPRSHGQGAGTSWLLAGLGGNSSLVEKCLTWGLLPARGQEPVFWLCEGRRDPGHCPAFIRPMWSTAGQVLTSWRAYRSPKSSLLQVSPS